MCHNHSEETSQSKQNNTEHNMHQKTHNDNISQLKNGTHNSSRDSKDTREFPEHDPFDQRAIQTYSTLDEVLPKVVILVFTDIYRNISNWQAVKASVSHSCFNAIF